mmetsp:Transcript_9487/g.23737  ORF Transcript_9487/g.23737 Transcript_9487/m.23737 type:complete len:196 (+) Transcript_9487:126-713(+)
MATSPLLERLKEREREVGRSVALPVNPKKSWLVCASAGLAAELLLPNVLRRMILFPLFPLALLRVELPIPMYRTVFSVSLGSMCGLATVAAGFYVRHQAKVEFERAQTPSNFSDVESLATTGCLSYTRNPLYLAGALIHVGVSMLLECPFLLLSIIPQLLYLQFVVVPNEEALLTRLFPTEFQKYCNRTPRWLFF